MKKVMLIYLVLLYIVGTSAISYAQGVDRYQPTKVIPPSPTAASLGAYGDVPVSYYTGSANIDIPLYNINSGDITLPVSLSYNASGIRVSQEASWVGLGWSLFAGGVITRSIRGLDDFAAGYNTSGDLPPNDSDNNYTAANEADVPYFQGVEGRYIDTEPDIFFYNFAGYTGKFVMSKQIHGSKAMVVNQNNLHIVYNSNARNWLVKTPDGLQYTFAMHETTEDYSNVSELIKFSGLDTYVRSYQENISAWYLTSIKSPTGRTVDFSYETGESLSTINISQTRYDLLQILDLESDAPLNRLYNYFFNSRQVIKDVYLKKIIFDNGYLLFERTIRDDIEPVQFSASKPSKLSEIKLYNLKNELLRHFSFDYSYFNNPSGEIPGTSNIPYTYKRLKLDAVTENNVKKHSFAYNHQGGLPGKYSRQVDEYGFYSTFYAPKLFDENFYPTSLPEAFFPAENKYFNGVQRTPDQTGNYSKRGVLESITYPTGGKTLFDYEVHDYSNLNATNNFILDPEVASAYADDDIADYQLTANFSLTEKTAVEFTPTAYVYTGDETLSSTENFAYLLNSNNNNIINYFNLANGQRTIILEPGTYTLKVDAINNYYTRLFAAYDIKVMIQSKKGGGLRVKTITNVNVDGKSLKVKRFVYSKNNTVSGVTSGRQISKGIHHYITPVKIVTSKESTIDPGVTYYFSSEGTYLVRTTSSIFSPGFSSQGNVIGYDQVTVLEGQNGEGGRTEYKYFNTEDYIDPITFPGVPTLSSTKNGKLEWMIVRSSLGMILEKEVYNYTRQQTSSIKGLKIYKPFPESWPQYYPHNIDHYSHRVKYYDNVSDWWVLSSEDKTTYLNGKAITNTYNYEYNNSEHKQKTAQSSLQSDGSLLNIQFKYSHDFPSQVPYNEMISLNMISPVIEQQSYKGSIPIEGVFTEYVKWNGTAIAPSVIKSKQGSLGYQSRLKFHNYDTKGNILSVSKEDDVIYSYVWGYTNTLPIVKGSNVTDTDLNAKVGEVLSEMGFTTLDAFLSSIGAVYSMGEKSSWNTFNAKLRTKFPGGLAQLATYAYAPLSGVVAEVDANNKSVFYEYDGLGRLLVIRDHTNSILKTYNYYYKQ